MMIWEINKDIPPDMVESFVKVYRLASNECMNPKRDR